MSQHSVLHQVPVFQTKPPLQFQFVLIDGRINTGIASKQQH